jgi:predicted XRE-type DNA-binding protein
MTQITEYPDFIAALDLEKSEAERLRLEVMVMRDLINVVKSWGVTQTEAARKLGIAQPRLNYLLKGRLSKFSLGILIDLSQKAGLNYDLIKRAA